MKPGLDKAELSQTTKPTQDLFRHVNGSWLDSTEIPEDKAVFGSFHMLADDSELAVKEILEEAANNPLPGVSHIDFRGAVKQCAVGSCVQSKPE